MAYNVVTPKGWDERKETKMSSNRMFGNTDTATLIPWSEYEDGGSTDGCDIAYHYAEPEDGGTMVDYPNKTAQELCEWLEADGLEQVGTSGISKVIFARKPEN